MALGDRGPASSSCPRPGQPPALSLSQELARGRGGRVRTEKWLSLDARGSGEITAGGGHGGQEWGAGHGTSRKSRCRGAFPGGAVVSSCGPRHPRDLLHLPKWHPGSLPAPHPGPTGHRGPRQPLLWHLGTFGGQPQPGEGVAQGGRAEKGPSETANAGTSCPAFNASGECEVKR